MLNENVLIEKFYPIGFSLLLTGVTWYLQGMYILFSLFTSFTESCRWYFLGNFKFYVQRTKLGVNLKNLAENLLKK